jgi:hypothetical protein
MGSADRHMPAPREALAPVRDRAAVVTSISLLLIAAVAWEWIARATGGAFLLLGVAVALRPDLVAALGGGHAM